MLTGLSTNWINLGPFWTGYVLDMAGPAWVYILFRGLFTQYQDNIWRRFFTPCLSFWLLITISFLIEAIQFAGWYPSTFDPWDMVAYLSILLPLHLLDLKQQNGMRLTDPKNGEVTITPATESDRLKIYRWLTQSNLTPEMMGPPLYPDSPIPDYEAFLADYSTHYFDGSIPEEGRCFIIRKNGKAIGQINYNSIDREAMSTEIDIWMSDRKFTGKGYGPAAIRLLCAYLYSEFGCREMMLAPSSRNQKAIRAYEKAGFRRTDRSLDPEKMDYPDVVVMIREWP